MAGFQGPLWRFLRSSTMFGLSMTVEEANQVRSLWTLWAVPGYDSNHCTHLPSTPQDECGTVYHTGNLGSRRWCGVYPHNSVCFHVKLTIHTSAGNASPRKGRPKPSFFLLLSGLVSFVSSHKRILVYIKNENPRSDTMAIFIFIICLATAVLEGAFCDPL